MRSLANALRIARISLVCVVVAIGYGCARNPRADITPGAPPTTTRFVAAEVIAEVKDFSVALGGHATDNFLRHSDRHTSDTRCYYTGKLQLPEFYSALRMVREDADRRSEEHTSELQSQSNLVCRLLLEKKKKKE